MKSEGIEMDARNNLGQNRNRSACDSRGASQNRQGQSAPPKRAFADGEAEALPANFVDVAQVALNRVARKHYRDNNGQERWDFNITTSKIRKLLGLVIDIYNAEHRRTEETLLEKSVLAVQMARVHIVYEAGRDAAVRQFVEASKLLPYIKGIGNSRANLIRYTQYLEALVAYHRYMGGREN